MAKYTTLSALFTAIANSLRGKTGGTGAIVADDFPSVIDSLSTGGITPTGTKTITTNGTHDVTNYASANVNVPVGTTPSGTKEITTNGTHDVTNYASAKVNVPTGITPSGSISITANGTHNVTNYASAVVNVPSQEQNAVVRTFTLSSDTTGTNALVTLLSNDAFIKEHYADADFSVLVSLATPVASATNVIHSVYQGNRNIGSSNVSRTGFIYRSTSASAIGMAACTTEISGKGYGSQLRAASDGSLKQYLSTGHILKAGTYMVVLTCATE